MKKKKMMKKKKKKKKEKEKQKMTLNAVALNFEACVDPNFIAKVRYSMGVESGLNRRKGRANLKNNSKHTPYVRVLLEMYVLSTIHNLKELWFEKV